MGSNQYWAARVYDLCVYFMAGTPEGSTESGFMEKPEIEPVTPGLQDIGLSPTSRRLHNHWLLKWWASTYNSGEPLTQVRPINKLFLFQPKHILCFLTKKQQKNVSIKMCFNWELKRTISLRPFFKNMFWLTNRKKYFQLHTHIMRVWMGYND